jgi:heavy metal sensor kinase
MVFRSIRARLTLWYMSLLTVTLVVLGGAGYGVLSYSLSNQVDQALNGVARVLAEQTGPEQNPHLPPDVDEVFRRFFGFSPWDRYFRMLDPLGRRDPRHGTTRSERLPVSPGVLENASRGLPTFETLESVEPYPVRILTLPVLQGGRVVHLVQVGTSLQSVFETLNRFLLIMAGLLPIGVLLAGAGGWMLARRALLPVDRMTEAANRIGAEHLADRLEETGADDELDRLAGTLNGMLARLDGAFSQVRRFTANASHELQTPLTILKGELEVALRAVRSLEEYQETLRSGLDEVNRMIQLVDSLLLLARSEAGVLRREQHLVDLAELVAQVGSRLKVLADSRSVELSVGPMEPLLVLGDAEHLGRLLSNLVENGIKYSEEGGRVSVWLERFGDRAAVQVSDTGPGIPEDLHEQIYQPFFRSPDALSHRGVGLGLSIARSIALAHSGSIEVRSSPGRGSTFTLLLPIVSDQILE